MTPTVANVPPGPKTGRMSEIRVSIPPEKRMTQSEIVPIACAEEVEMDDM